MHATTPRLAPAAGAPPIALMRRFDAPPMRPACHPAVDRWDAAFGAADARRVLRERGRAAGAGGQRALVLDVHLPLERARLPRAPAPRHVRALRQFAALEDEIRLAAGALGVRQAVAGLRLHGECIGALDDASLMHLLDVLRDAFAFDADTALGIEIDPATTGLARLATLRRRGFGEVAFDLRRPRLHVRGDGFAERLRAARQLGFATVAVRVAHGGGALPPCAWTPDAGAVARLRPDRIVLEAVAVAGRAGVACSGADAGAGVPPPLSLARAQRAGARAAAIEAVLAEGYVHVGMDQFALPGDRLAVARRQGRCHVDVDGVHDGLERDRLGLGPGATSRVGHCYFRNAARAADWRDALRAGRLAVEAGRRLSRDDLVRRTLIHALVGNGRVDFESLALAHLVDVRRLFAPALERLAPRVRAGHVPVDADGIELTPQGDCLAGAVAAVFEGPDDAPAPPAPQPSPSGGGTR